MIRDGDLCKRRKAAPQIMVNPWHGLSEKQLQENWELRRCDNETRPALGKNSSDTDETDTFKNQWIFIVFCDLLPTTAVNFSRREWKFR